MASTRSRRAGPLGGQSPPRVRLAPSVRANSWEDVADLSANLGIPLDEWQETVMQAAMGERSDGTWASRIIGLSTPRQNGKSQLIVSRALAGILLFDERTIICSAHQTDTAREVFQRMLDVIEDNPSLERRVDSIMKAVNREYIRFKGGQTIKFKARSAGGGRGFSCDCLLLDEAQILGRPAWSAMLPTMSARPNPQAWLFGTPPTPQDDGEVFGQIRAQGMAGSAPRLTYLEWSASVGDDINDPAIWAKANPAYGTRVTHEACESERGAMTDAQFAMERLGMWDEAGEGGAISVAAWSKLADIAKDRGESVVFGLDVTEDRAAWISVAWRRPDGNAHLMLTNDGQPLPAHMAFDECARLVGQWGGVVAASKPLEAELLRAGVPVLAVSSTEFTVACGALADAVTAGTVRHDNQKALNDSVKAVKWRNAGAQAERAFQLRDCPEAGPVASVTRALHGLNPNTKIPMIHTWPEEAE